MIIRGKYNEYYGQIVDSYAGGKTTIEINIADAELKERARTILHYLKDIECNDPKLTKLILVLQELTTVPEYIIIKKKRSVHNEQNRS